MDGAHGHERRALHRSSKKDPPRGCFRDLLGHRRRKLLIKAGRACTLKTYLSKTPFLTLAGEAWLDDLFPSLQGASPKALAQFFQTTLSRRGDLARQGAITSIKIDLLAFFLHQSQWSSANAILDVLPHVAIANLENAIQRPLDDMRRQFVQSWHQGHLLIHEAAAIGFFSPEDISQSRASQQTWRRLQEQSLIDPAATKMHPDQMDRRRGFPLVALRDVLHPAFAMRAEIKKVPRPKETAAEVRARFKATMRG